MAKFSSFLRRVGILKRNRLTSDERWRIGMDDLGGTVGRIVTEAIRLPGAASRVRANPNARQAPPRD